MIAAHLLQSPFLTLQQVTDLLPGIEKKFIRNSTDRELVFLAGSKDPRLYTVRNVLQLRILHEAAATGTVITTAKLVAALASHRMEQRCNNGTLGTRADMYMLVYALDVPRSRGADADPNLRIYEFCTEADVGAVVARVLDKAPEARVLRLDEIIEDIAERLLARLPDYMGG